MVKLKNHIDQDKGFWSELGEDGDPAEFDQDVKVNGNLTVTGGIVLTSGFGTRTAGIFGGSSITTADDIVVSEFALGKLVDGTSDNLALVITPNGTDEFLGTIRWKEYG